MDARQTSHSLEINDPPTPDHLHGTALRPQMPPPPL
jgi:hypothetical protein